MTSPSSPGAVPWIAGTVITYGDISGRYHQVAGRVCGGGGGGGGGGCLVGGSSDEYVPADCNPLQ